MVCLAADLGDETKLPSHPIGCCDCQLNVSQIGYLIAVLESKLKLSGPRQKSILFDYLSEVAQRNSNI
jgi:hypothetical protein